LVTKDKVALKKLLRVGFDIKLPGGIVTKKDTLLLIYRLGKWIFLKGKFDKGETPFNAHFEKWEEECAIK